MLYVDKIDDKNISFRIDDGEISIKAATYYADQVSNSVFIYHMRNGVATYGPIKIEELTINGVPATSVSDAVKSLNSFIGNFRRGGSSPSPTTEIIDSLDSDRADAALSANQGRILNEELDNRAKLIEGHIDAGKGIASRLENIGEGAGAMVSLGSGVVERAENVVQVGYGRVRDCNAFLAVGNVDGSANYGAGFGYLQTIEGDGAQLAMGGIGCSALGGIHYTVVSCSGNKVVLDTELGQNIVGASIRFLYKEGGIARSCSAAMKITAIEGAELTIDGAAPDINSIWGISLYGRNIVDSGYGQMASGLGAVALGAYSQALGIYAKATGEGSMAILKNGWAKHKNVLCIGAIDSTEDDGAYLGVPIKSGVLIRNNDKDISIPRGGNTLMDIRTTSQFGGFVQVHIDGDGGGAGGGMRFYHKGQIKLQMLTGNPDYAFSEGTTFDVIDGNLCFDVRKAGSLIKFSKVPNKGAPAAFTFDVHNNQLSIGTPVSGVKSALAINAPGHSQLTLENKYTPSGTGDTNGDTGSIAWDDNYCYVKATDGWKRMALETF